MHPLLKSLPLILLIALGGTAIAQEATETTADEATDTTPPDLNLGEPVGPQVGQAYVRQEFGDWEMRCVKTPEGQDDPCNLYQLLENDDGVAVAEFNLFRLPPGSRAAAGATIVVPLETLLTQQLTLAVDGANARRYPFTFCNPGGCVARLGFTEAEVQQFKRGNVATIRLVPAADPEQEVVLDVSLIGFTAGFDGSAVVE
ncbi:invasion associated locus B family protein [Cognatiyoonia sp. IB215446]|uniref:invasion associated locus B family protein n=1 Tax=Cognatiyoonia sp. IB215446 TaxID=3097355 RepID=UPI002A0C236D|nr:invasion associated locus B family protein [Cognatiyoonia sp. IB215446]MDX8349086.1 invasion associated locus B family protein [Cognatiyoonia sp. IB215446]